MNKGLLGFLVFLVVGLVAISGCTSNTNANTVTIQNNTFNPATLYVQTNSTITWINKDSVTHRVVSNSGLFDSGNLTTGMSYNYTFNKAGSYPYHDLMNPSITGTIVVNATNSSGSGIPGY
jgi:plastocyanin